MVECLSPKETTWVRFLVPPPSPRRSSAPQNEGGIRLGYGEVKPASMQYVYILKCRDSRLYVGCTSDIEDRIERHRKDQIPATRDRLPVELHCYFEFNDKYRAYDFEKYLKSGSGRAFMRKHLI